jgi:hypothetical protein
VADDVAVEEVNTGPVVSEFYRVSGARYQRHNLSRPGPPSQDPLGLVVSDVEVEAVADVADVDDVEPDLLADLGLEDREGLVE